MNIRNLHIAIRGLSIFLFFIVLIFCNSCKNLRINREVKRLYGTKIEIPDNLFAKIQGRDTVFQKQGDEYATLIIWYDSVQCASCSLNYIEIWDRIFKYSIDSVKGFKPMIIFSPSKQELYKFEVSLKTTDFEYPIYIDYDHYFEKKNSQLSSSGFNVLLLDKNHEIVLVGNPFYNTQMWELYRNTINMLIMNKGIIPI